MSDKAESILITYGLSQLYFMFFIFFEFILFVKSPITLIFLSFTLRFNISPIIGPKLSPTILFVPMQIKIKS